MAYRAAAGLLVLALAASGCSLGRSRDQVPQRAAPCVTWVDPETPAEVLRDRTLDRIQYCQFADGGGSGAAEAGAEEE